MKKTLKQKVAALAVGALVLTGSAAGSIAMAAPAQAYSTKLNYVWNPYGAVGKKCSEHRAIDYNWFEELAGNRDKTVFVQYMTDAWCGR